MLTAQDLVNNVIRLYYDDLPKEGVEVRIADDNSYAAFVETGMKYCIHECRA